MTIDALRTRKRELMARRQQLEQSGADKLSLALLSEELMDVNAQLRALTYGRRKKGRDTNSAHVQDRRQYDAWARQEDQEKAGQEREALRKTAAESLGALTDKQREIFALYAGGMRQKEISEKLSLNPSSVSRTLSRAKRNAAEHVRISIEGQRIMDRADKVDLTDEGTLRAVVLAMTSTQLLYFYLYYSEGLSLREVGDLTGTHHSAICRTIKRALLRLDKLFPGGTVLEHPEAIDEAAYWAWRELDASPELVPEPVRALVQKPRPAKYWRDWHRKTSQTTTSVSVRRTKQQTPGKLLLVLRERAKAGMPGLFRWLESVFFSLRQKLRGRN